MTRSANLMSTYSTTTCFSSVNLTKAGCRMSKADGCHLPAYLKWSPNPSQWTILLQHTITPRAAMISTRTEATDSALICLRAPARTASTHRSLVSLLTTATLANQPTMVACRLTTIPSLTLQLVIPLSQAATPAYTVCPLTSSTTQGRYLRHRSHPPTRAKIPITKLQC